MLQRCNALLGRKTAPPYQFAVSSLTSKVYVCISCSSWKILLIIVFHSQHLTPRLPSTTSLNEMAVTVSDVFKIFFAFFLPPLGVFLEVGFDSLFWINILLTLLGWIPGVIHAFYVILKY